MNLSFTLNVYVISETRIAKKEINISYMLDGADYGRTMQRYSLFNPTRGSNITSDNRTLLMPLYGPAVKITNTSCLFLHVLHSRN